MQFWEIKSELWDLNDQLQEKKTELWKKGMIGFYRLLYLSISYLINIETEKPIQGYIFLS